MSCTPTSRLNAVEHLTIHGAERANERSFTSDAIDNIIDNDYKTRKSKIDPVTGEKT